MKIAELVSANDDHCLLPNYSSWNINDDDEDRRWMICVSIIVAYERSLQTLRRQVQCYITAADCVTSNSEIDFAKTDWLYK